MKIKKLRPTNGQFKAKDSNLEPESVNKDCLMDLEAKTMAKKKEKVSQKENVTTEELKELFGDAFAKKEGK